MTNLIRAVVHDRIHLTQGIIHAADCSAFRIFQPADIEYVPYCDDFGPHSTYSIVNFTVQLRSEISQFPHSKIIYCVEPGTRPLANAVFLLGAYMMLVENMSVHQICDAFDWLQDDDVELFRDATVGPSEVLLSLEDCWAGLWRGRELGWIQAPREGENEEYWGDINIAEYDHYDNPFNGDFHEVVPGAFIAFRSPQDLGGAAFHDDPKGFRVFAPDFYASVFHDDFRVAAVVQLNESCYDPAPFLARGIPHHHLEFDDCTCPPSNLVRAFLDIADRAVASGGLVAVHCKAGLGRTGTLIALYMMRTHGFTARGAMAWLRVMRPGSVLGRQQAYLCRAEVNPPCTT